MGLKSRDIEGAPVCSARYLWFCLPVLLIRFVGLVVGLSLILTSWKLDVYAELPWWKVFLPIEVAMCVIYVVLTIGIIVWANVAVLFFTGRLEIEHADDFRLDVLFRTAKICFLSHGLVTLLMLSLGLLLLKLYYWSNLPVVYPLLPLIVLGMAYIFLALIFTQREVDSPWFLLVGIFLLSQSVTLAIKLDITKESKHMPWGLAFTPSWVTYACLLIYCVLSPINTYREARAEANTGSASSSMAYGGAQRCSREETEARLHKQLLKVVGIACWAFGWGLSQAVLTLRLDGLYKVSWLAVILPALVGWILLLVFVTGVVKEYFTEVAELLLQTFSLAPLCECLKDSSIHSEEEDPLIIYGDLRYCESNYPLH